MFVHADMEDEDEGMSDFLATKQQNDRPQSSGETMRSLSSELPGKDSNSKSKVNSFVLFFKAKVSV